MTKCLSVLGLLALLLLLGSAPAPGAATAPYAYHWPVKPFDSQHPIRGAFGDPRTLAVDQPFGVTGPKRSGAYSFHNGIDIVAPRGTPVYPVVSGRVVIVRRSEIVVHSSNEREFQYRHLRLNVKVGQKVVAAETILGWIHKPFDHLHLTEIDNHRVHNPLAPGHLEPYSDDTKPRAVALDVSNSGSPHLTQGGWISREDSLAIKAVDRPAMAVPGPFAGLPQAPALVEWRLGHHHVWGRWHVAADFRRTVPTYSLWEVYAAGTYQNSPVFDHRLFQGVPGRYLFRIGLDPSRLRPGRYALEARVSDIRGNSSLTSWRLKIGRA